MDSTGCMEDADGIRSPVAKKNCKMATPPRFVPKAVNGAACVHIFNVPQPFMEKTFVSYLLKLCQKNNIPLNKADIILIEDNSKEGGYILVEFASSDIAERVEKIRNAVFLRQQLNIVLAVYSHETVMNDGSIVDDTVVAPIMSSTPFAPEMVQIQKSFIKLSPFKHCTKRNILSPCEEKSSKEVLSIEDDMLAEELENSGDVHSVEFGNIHAPFSADDFERFLKRCISKKCKQPAHFSMKCYNEEALTVLVNFDSAESAEEVCSELQFVEYMLEPWTLTLISQEDPCVSKLPLSCVEFSNIKPPFEQDYFERFLKLCISKKCKRPADFSIKCYNEKALTVLVDFDSAESAEQVCSELQFVEYMLEPWTLTLVSQGDPLPCHVSSDVGVYCGPTGVCVEDGDDECVTLSSHEGKEIFYRALLKTREFFRSKHNHGSGYVQIISLLKEKNIDATIPEITKMRRNLGNLFNFHKRTGNVLWPQYQLCKVIFGFESPDSLSKTLYADALLLLDPATVCSKFTAGAVFHKESRQDLIQILTQNVDSYRKGAFGFWDHVSSLMGEMGHHYSADACKIQFKELESKFKEIDVVKRNTGAPKLDYLSKWEHFREMQDFYTSDVTMNPSMTVASGSTSKVEFSEGVGGKSVTNPLKKPTSRRNQRLDTLSMIAHEFARANDLKERYMEQNNK